MRWRLLGLPLFLLIGACTSAAVDGTAGGPAYSSRGLPGVAVTVIDERTRPPVDPAEVVMLSYSDDPRPIPGCTVIANFFLETGSRAQMLSAAAHEAARLGATAVIIGVGEQHSVPGRRGLGAATLSTSYRIEAIDCR